MAAIMIDIATPRKIKIAILVLMTFAAMCSGARGTGRGAQGVGGIFRATIWKR